MSTKQLTRIALFTALMIVFTITVPSISVPIITVPFTLQTLIMMLSGIVLSPKEAFLSMLTYLLIGVVGIPVFSNYQSGLQALLGPTGGFLISFPFAALLISYFKKDNQLTRHFIVTFLFGIVFVYVIGVLVLSQYIKTPYLETFQSMQVFVLFDVVKAVIASYLGMIIHQQSKRWVK